MRETDVERWDAETDVIVVGFGAAGGVAAIEAHDAGAEVILLEKMPFPGGLSAISAGGIRIAENAGDAFTYLQATCGNRTPDDLLHDLAQGMVDIPEYVRGLARVSDAQVGVTGAVGNYPFPGCMSLGYCEVTDVPALAAGQRYSATSATTNGGRLIKVLEDNITHRGIDLRYETAAGELVIGNDGQVRGLIARRAGRAVALRAAKAVILTCGGFENNPDMQDQYFQAGAIRPTSFRGNTGDGIAMAQAAGADLWHMWHVHGPYALSDPTGEYPFALFHKGIPMWTPGVPGSASDLGIEPEEAPDASRKPLARLAWILVDRDGRRFMNEYPPYPGDTGMRPFDQFDPLRQEFARMPAYMIFDEAGRQMYPMGYAAYNDAEVSFEWSRDNLREVERGIFHRADSLAALAEGIGVPGNRMRETLDAWNAAVSHGQDTVFGRPENTMVRIDTPPFYYGEVRPAVINTQGGPRHNVRQEVVTPFGHPIPRLYAAGELGSVFGHLYMSGGNLAECIVGGRRAGREAASLARQVSPPAPHGRARHLAGPNQEGTING